MDAREVMAAVAKQVQSTGVTVHIPCEHCGRLTSERYCDNDCRRVDKSAVGPCKVHGDECPTLSSDW